MKTSEPSKEQRELRIKPVPPPPPKKKVSFHLPEPTVERLDRYLAVFKEIYNENPDHDFIVDQMINAFLDSDKGFSDYLKNSSAPGNKEGPGGSSAGTPA